MTVRAKRRSTATGAVSHGEAAVGETGAAILAFGASLAGLLLALPALLLTAPFWLVGTLTEWLGEALGRRPLPWDALIEFDSRAGWRPRPNMSTWAGDLNQDTFRISTDGDGWRGRATLDSAQVVVFGDSFAQGFGVDDRDFFADLPTKVEVKAVGCAGYNMLQSRRWMEAYADRLRGKLVVWLLYLGNDLEDDLNPAVGRYRQPFLRSSDGGVTWSEVDGHVSPEPWTASSQEGSRAGYVELCRGGFHARRALAAFESRAGPGGGRVFGRGSAARAGHRAGAFAGRATGDRGGRWRRAAAGRRSTRRAWSGRSPESAASAASRSCISATTWTAATTWSGTTTGTRTATGRWPASWRRCIGGSREEGLACRCPSAAVDRWISGPRGARGRRRGGAVDPRGPIEAASDPHEPTDPGIPAPAQDGGFHAGFDHPAVVPPQGAL